MSKCLTASGFRLLSIASQSTYHIAKMGRLSLSFATEACTLVKHVRVVFMLALQYIYSSQCDMHSLYSKKRSCSTRSGKQRDGFANAQGHPPKYLPAKSLTGMVPVSWFCSAAKSSNLWLLAQATGKGPLKLFLEMSKARRLVRLSMAGIEPVRLFCACRTSRRRCCSQRHAGLRKLVV